MLTDLLPLFAVVAIAAGALLIGLAIGRYLNIKEPPNMSAETDALQASLSAAKSASDSLAAAVGTLTPTVAKAVSQLTDGAAITAERDALKAENADLTSKVTAMQAQVDAITAQDQAAANALAALNGQLPAA